jgi:hypothetical protein
MRCSVTHPRQSVVTFPTVNIANWNFADDGQSIMTLDQQGQVGKPDRHLPYPTFLVMNRRHGVTRSRRQTRSEIGPETQEFPDAIGRLDCRTGER